MALDYNNLPLLMTIEDIAEVFRCTPGTIRRKLANEPAWLSPVRHGLMRRQLFATVDVMAHLGHAAPAVRPAPLQGVVDHWNPETAEGALDRAVADRKAQQMEKRLKKYFAVREAWEHRVKTHRPTARLQQVGLSENKVVTEASEDGERFRITIRFQPRFRPDGWPAQIPIPRSGPEWVALKTDKEMNALIAEIEEVMADYRPRWDQMVETARRARQAGRLAKKPDA